MTKISSVSAPVPVFSNRRTGPAPRDPERSPAAAGNRTAARTPPPLRSADLAPKIPAGRQEPGGACDQRPQDRQAIPAGEKRPRRLVVAHLGRQEGPLPSATYGGFETTTANRPPAFQGGKQVAADRQDAGRHAVALRVLARLPQSAGRDIGGHDAGRGNLRGKGHRDRPAPGPNVEREGALHRGTSKGGHCPFRQPLRLGTRDERVGGEQELPSVEVPGAENVLQRLAGRATRDQREQPHRSVADLVVHGEEEASPGIPVTAETRISASSGAASRTPAISRRQITRSSERST